MVTLGLGFTTVYWDWDFGLTIFVHTGYPNTYGNDLSVSMPIKVPSGSKIELTFVDIDIENDASCRYDYVQGMQQYLVI